MPEYHHSLLVEDGLPDLVELLHSEEVDNDSEVAADVELVHLYLGPCLYEVLVEFCVGCVDEGEVVVVREEDLDDAGQS